MEDALRLLAATLLGYLAGSFPSAGVVSRIATRGRVDLRRDGSGNPGGLNAMKTIGTAWGVVVVVADMAKGVVAGVVGMIVAAAAAVGVLRTRHPERTVWGNAVVWNASAVVWWLADLPNLWGPAPTWGLVAFSAIGSAMVLWKFRATSV